MNTKLLKYALEYAACNGNVQEAAKRLSVNRSSIVRNVHKLEEELGTELFINSPKGIIQTQAGCICLKYAKKIIREEENLRFDYTEGEKYSGILDVGMGSTRSQQILPSVVPKFHRLYPNIRLYVHEFSTAKLISNLLSMRLDFAVMSQPEEPLAGILFEPFMTEQMVLIAPKEDPFVKSIEYMLSGRPTVPLSCFINKPFILSNLDQKSYMVAKRLFKAASIDPDIVMQTGSKSSSIHLAYHGMGYALIPKSMVLTEGNIIPYYYLEPNLNARWTVGIATFEDNRPSHVSLELRKLIADVMNCIN